MGQGITTTKIAVDNGLIIAARAVPDGWTSGLMYWRDGEWEHVAPPAPKPPRAVRPLATVTYGPFLLTPVWRFRDALPPRDQRLVPRLPRDVRRGWDRLVPHAHSVAA